MRKFTLIVLCATAALAVAAAVAAQMGSRPAASACAASLPSGAFVTYRAQAADGNCLQGYVWAPEGTPVRAAVVLVHGIHDHAQRYAALAQALNAAGVAVLAQDHRGHGASGGARQRIDSVEQASGDVQLALQQARQRYPGVPLFVYGHSMGGLVAAHMAANAAAKPGQPLAGAIVSSAALVRPSGASAVQIGVVRTLSALAPGLPLEAIDEARFVREPAARAALAADPLIEREKVPARTVAAVLAGIDGIQPRMASIQPPLLVLHGGADVITEVAGSRELARRASGATLKVYDAALHDLQHEPEGAAVRQDIVAFVLAKAPAR